MSISRTRSYRRAEQADSPSRVESRLRSLIKMVERENAEEKKGKKR